MSERAEKLKPILAELSPDERAELFAYFESQDGTEKPMSAEEWQEAWIDEIDRRAAAVDAGFSVCTPAAVVMQRMKERHG
jgi:hypothetical protein